MAPVLEPSGENLTHSIKKIKKKPKDLELAIIQSTYSIPQEENIGYNYYQGYKNYTDEKSGQNSQGSKEQN